MKRVLSFLVAVCVAGAVAPRAGRCERSVFLSFSTLKLGNASRVHAIGVDGANRVWFAADTGVAALVGDRLAPFFPLNKNSDGLLDDAARAVAFGALEEGENFFLGFNGPSEGTRGIQYGRVLSETGLSPKPPSSLDTGGMGVLDLASDGSTLWSATTSGVRSWALGGGAPQPNTTIYQENDEITRLALAPWAGDPALVFFDSQDARLYLVRSDDPSATRLVDPNLSTLGGMAFSRLTGDLWVVGTPSSGTADLLRYPAQPLQGSDPGGSQPDGFSFPVNRTLRDVAVDPFDGTVWVATDQGAYFQTPGPDGSLQGSECLETELPGRGCWAQEKSSRFDRVDRITVDPSGNVWMGTDEGVRGILVRLLTISATRFVGEDARAVVTLEDLPGFEGNGIPDEVTTIEVTVGSTARQLEVTEDGDTGRFTLTFGFTLGESTSDTVFPVQSTADGVPVAVSYTFTDALGVERTLAVSASWANIEDFEDDLWIGGPCFLGVLGR